jgi:C4-type Zn-finger protein
MMRKCPVCGGNMTGAGRIAMKSPKSNRKITRGVIRCGFCGHRTIGKCC